MRRKPGPSAPSMTESAACRRGSSLRRDDGQQRQGLDVCQSAIPMAKIFGADGNECSRLALTFSGSSSCLGVTSNPRTMKLLLLTLLSFATLVRGDDALQAIKVIETQNHVKFIGQAPISGSDRTQWVFAAPDTANGIRIRIHVISFPSRLEYLAAELSAFGEAKAAYEQSKEPKRERLPTPPEQAVGARLELGDAFGTNPATGAYQIYNVNTKKWRPIQ
jgi:hypothetical protein